MIAIISVAREEFGYFKSLMAVDREQKIAGIDFYSGKLEGVEIVLACSGMNQLHSAIATQAAIDRFDIDAVIASGPAGPLVPYLQQGDLVIANRLIQFHPDHPHNTDPQFSQMLDESLIVTNSGFTGRITDAYNEVFGGKSNRPQLVMGTVISSDYAISDRKTVGRLLRDFGVVAIDRNGATLAQVCRMNEKPCLLIRTVIDTPDGAIYNYFDSQLQVMPEYITSLVRHFIAAPSPVAVE